MDNWKVSHRIAGPAARSTPVVSLRLASLRIDAVHFATPASGRNDFHYFYYSVNTYPLLPGKDLKWWSRGNRINDPEWVRNRQGNEHYRACFTRKAPVSMRVKLVLTPQGTVPITGKLFVTPLLDGSAAYLQAANVQFTYPANAAEHWVALTTAGALPDEVGRYILKLKWEMTGDGFRFGGPEETQHKIYTVYGQPLQAGYDSPTVGDTGRQTTRDEGTWSGTKIRFDRMMSIIGGNRRRRIVATPNDVIELYWRLHTGINDTPGAPPYFNGDNNEHITTGPGGKGLELPLDDQWLAWVPNQEQWNDASCIGHVQLAKTMLAAVGLFGRRTWVLPHTPRLPNGNLLALADTDLYCLGNYNAARRQTWTFTYNSRTYVATPYLMEPGQSWEFFEACLMTPNGKFLPGGYATGSCPARFRTNKGFNSAGDLLRWWANTTRPGFGKRFMCWVYYNQTTDEVQCWDVDGRHYDVANYVRIRDTGKELPPP